MISYSSISVKFHLPKKRLLSKWIKLILADHNLVPGDINFIFTDDPTLLKYNIDFLGHDYFTDVITFDTSSYANTTIPNKVSGDIFISIDRVKDNSQTYEVAFENELYRVISHGVLHLIGYDDLQEVDKLEMRDRENYYIDQAYKLIS